MHRVVLTKREFRSKILLRLKTQKEEDRNKKSRVIKNKLFRRSVFKQAKKIMFYIAFDGEVNTEEMIKEAHKLGKIVAVPVCKPKRIIRPSILKEKAALVRGLYGIGEPRVKNFMSFKELDLVIVPGIAFDRHGRRLGRGKGYYDRFLRKIAKRTLTIGLAFDFQILPSIPATAMDINVDHLIFA